MPSGRNELNRLDRTRGMELVATPLNPLLRKFKKKVKELL
jgi:hypothetical protein